LEATRVVLALRFQPPTSNYPFYEEEHPLEVHAVEEDEGQVSADDHGGDAPMAYSLGGARKANNNKKAAQAKK
jgi:hypothetical protein